MFAWRDFLLAMGMMVLLWYLGVGLVCYRPEIKKMLGLGIGSLPADRGGGDGKAGFAKSGLGAGDSGDVPGPFAGVDDSGLMGKRKLPEGMELLSASEVGFGDEGGDKVHKLGMVSDVVQEIREVLALLQEKGGGKKEFLFLLAEVADRYPGIAGFPSLASINAFVLEHAPFELTVAELMEVWG